MNRVVNQKRKKFEIWPFVKEKVSRKWKNWYHNQVDDDIKGVDYRDTVKHNERRDQLFLEMLMSVAEQE